MHDSVHPKVVISSLRRLYRVAGTALGCVFLNYLLLAILPAGFQAQIFKDLSWMNQVSTEGYLLWAVVVAPAWETIFQALPAYMLGRRPSRGRVLVYILMASLPFAGVHAMSYSVLYAALLLPVSVILAATYYYFHRRNQMPYVMTAIVHGLINLFSYLLILITGGL